MTDTVNVPRDVIAKIIDPVAFEPMECIIGARKAYIKADAILAMLAAAPKAEPVSATDDLIDGFAAALKSKLNKAAEKYGYNDDWMRPEWREDLVRHLIAHVEKGDPRDVAAYCAFAWHHGWSVKPEAPKAEPVSDPDELDLYDDRVQAGISWALNQVGLSLGLSIGDWDGGDGSESVEGDVGAEIESILVSAKLRDPETGALATLHPEAPKVEQEPVAYVSRKGFTTGGLVWTKEGRDADLPDETKLYTHPAPASDELLEALAPFARHYDLNDCHERRPDDALEVPIYDLARAAELITKHKEPQS